MTSAVSIKPASETTSWLFSFLVGKAAQSAAIIALLIAFLVGCADVPDVHEYRFSGPTMGTQYLVKVNVDLPLSAEEERELGESINSELSTVDQLMSTYKSDSEVSVFNRSAVGTRHRISSQTYKVIEAALSLNERSGGAYDITVGPLVSLWGFGPEPMQRSAPEPERVKSALLRVGSNNLAIEGGVDLLKLGDVEVDLSSLAKGYAVDQVAALLSGMKLRNFMVEVGGEIRVSGQNKARTPWKLGVELPDTLTQRALNVVSMSEGALATSGDYRNYFEVEDKRYSHTINPRTGYPIEHRLASVSVLAPDCMTADAQATALMVLGEIEGYEFAAERGIDAMFIYRENGAFKVRYSGQFESYVIP